MSSRVAVVTGSNKGIGYGIVKHPCQQFDGIVYLTARNIELGNAAVAKIRAELPSLRSDLKFHQLDLVDKTSGDAFASHLRNAHGGLDILINNAGIAYKHDATEPFGVQAEVTVGTNYFGTLNICNALFPLLRPHARVVHVSSQAGLLKIFKRDELRTKLVSPTLTVDELNAIMHDFVRQAQAGTHLDYGYPGSAYGMSKVGMTTLGAIQQRMIDRERPNDDILVNACCPGYVDTDMTSHKGHLTIDQGAETPVFLALLPPNTASNPRGKFYYQKREMDWAGASANFA